MEEVRRQCIKRVTTHIIDGIKLALCFFGTKVLAQISDLYAQREFTWTFLGSALAVVAFGLLVPLVLFHVAQFVIVVSKRAMSDSPENHQASQEQSEVVRQTNDAICDIIILHTEDAKKEAYQFKNHLQSDLLLSDIKVDVSDEIGAGKGRLSIMDFVFKTYRYIFLYLSADFTEDSVIVFNSESNMVASLKEPSTKGRVIPIWPSEDIKKNGKVPQFISAILAVQYYDYFDESCKDNYIKKMKRLISSGRENYLKD